MNHVYLKIHKITKFMYIGVHNDSKISTEKYKGGGTRWNRHLKVHKNLVDTIILFSSISRESCFEAERYYISLSGAVTFNNNKFANLDVGGGGCKPGSYKGKSKHKLVDPRKGKRWEEIYGVEEAALKKAKQSAFRSGKSTKKKGTKQRGVDHKKGKTHKDIYGYNKYANPPKPFTVKIVYPDLREDTYIFTHEKHFF